MRDRGAPLLPPGPLGHHPLMPRRNKAPDAERVRFVAPPGTNDFYAEAAGMLGIPADAWMRAELHAAAVRVFEAHGRDTDAAPPVHLRRPPRLQPRIDPREDET